MKTIIAALLLILAAATAYAQKTGPNGGMLAGKGDHQVELVVGPSELSIYMLADGKAHGVKGSRLRAFVQTGGKSITVPLSAVGEEKLVGKLTEPLAKGAIVVVTGKDDHGDPVSARYTLK